MSDIKHSPAPAPSPADDKDVEGHNMWIGPTVAGDLARNRSRDLEKQARERQRAKESKRR